MMTVAGSLSDMMTVLMVLFLIISVTIAVTSTTRLVKMRGVLSYVSDQEDLLSGIGRKPLFEVFNRRHSDRVQPN